MDYFVALKYAAAGEGQTKEKYKKWKKKKDPPARMAFFSWIGW